jgi:acyl carrier protein
MAAVDRAQLREELVGFLDTIARPGPSIDAVDDDTNLFDSGLLDSLAVIQIILHLEQQHGVDMAAHGIDPNDLGSITGILNAIQRASG